MSNGDDAMTSAEFAKLMGAYPEPAGNPLPTYGGYMDNSAANFAWVNNNDYFGAEGDGLLHKPRCGWDECEGSEWCIHDSYDNCEQCGERKGLHDLFGEVGTCDDCLIPKRHDGEKYKTVLGTCVVCRGEDGDRGCDFCDLAYCDSGCFEEHIEDGVADGRNCDMEHLKGKEGWGAESFNAKQISRSRYQFTLDDWPIRIHVENCPMNPHAKRDGVYTPKEIAQKSYTVLYNHESLPQFEGNTFGELRKASNGLVVPCNCTINEMKVIKELDPATFTREPDETQEHWDAEDSDIASLEMWEDVLKDNPNDEEAQEQYNYWYGVVHGGRETPHNPDYDAESESNSCDVCETNKLLFEMTDMAANDVLCQSCIQDGHDSHWTIKTHIPETFPVDSEAYKTPKTEVGYTVGNGSRLDAEGESLMDLMLKKYQKEMTEQANCKCIDEDSCYGCGACYGCERGVGLMPINGKCGCGWTGKNHPQNKKQHEGDMWGAETFEAPFYPPEKMLPELKAALRATMEALSECKADSGIDEEEIEGLLASHPIIKRYGAETFEATPKWECDACGDMHDDEDEAESCCIEDCDHSDSEMASWGHAGKGSDFQMTCNNCGADGYGTFNTISWEHYDKTLEHERTAEMDVVADGMAVVSNIRDEMVGVVEVIDDEDDDEMVEISIQDENMEEIGSYTLDEGMILDDEDNYLAESKTPSLLTLGIGAVAAILAFPYLKEGVNKVFGADNDPELIENPDIGDLDPAQYEELVVESTGYALDIIPMGLDGSFMGSRFAALPTERYVDYNDPGIGAHTDIALNRDEVYLEPEMAMVQASEDVKEAQAPGQSPYLSIDGQEPKDFNYRVIKETHPVSLDPAVKPFIPQSMTGYTGNKNTPPSVYNKMFNLGVLGQTPLFTPQDAGDIGASRAGSRRATPDVLGLNGSVGGPLSDKVNANYTDGTTSMSLAQWAIENTVSQSSDTEAVVIDRSSGAMKRVRRV